MDSYFGDTANRNIPTFLYDHIKMCESLLLEYEFSGHPSFCWANLSHFSWCQEDNIFDPGEHITKGKVFLMVAYSFHFY